MPKVTHSWSRAGNPDALTISSPLQSRLLPQGQTLLQILLSLAVPCSMHDAKKSSVIVWHQNSIAELRARRCVVFANVKLLRNIKVRRPLWKALQMHCIPYLHRARECKREYVAIYTYTFRGTRAHKSSLLCSRAAHPYTQLLLV